MILQMLSSTAALVVFLSYISPPAFAAAECRYSNKPGVVQSVPEGTEVTDQEGRYKVCPVVILNPRREGGRSDDPQKTSGGFKVEDSKWSRKVQKLSDFHPHSFAKYSQFFSRGYENLRYFSGFPVRAILSR